MSDIVPRLSDTALTESVEFFRTIACFVESQQTIGLMRDQAET